MRKMILIVLILGIGSAAFGQTWQHYQLTNFPEPGQVRQCGSVADTLGNLHHYFIAAFGPYDYALYYDRTDAYGHVLTDTIRIDGFSDRFNPPFFTSVVGDGSHSWCVFSARATTARQRGLYLAGRDVDGQESQPTRLLGYPGGGEGPPSWDLSAVYRAQDSTIHLVGNVDPYCYYRFRTNGDTLIWHRRIDGVNWGAGPQIHLGPDGTPWAAMRSDYGIGRTEVLLVRFGEDTSETVYRPFGRDVLTYALGFSIDAAYGFNFMLNSDTLALGYIQLDSSLSLTSSYALDSTFDGFGTMEGDSVGNCLFVWDKDPGLKWAFRRADGTWMQRPTLISAHMTASSFSVVTMDSDRFAFTCQGHLRPEEPFLELQLYTYGFPPDAVPTVRVSQPAASLTAYPNPFGSALQIDLPATGGRRITLFDILGRTVWTAPLLPNASHVWVGDPSLAQLPSGTYFVSVQGNQPVAPKQIVHFK
jgi:hypothetical protein